MTDHSLTIQRLFFIKIKTSQLIRQRKLRIDGVELTCSTPCLDSVHRGRVGCVTDDASLR